MSSIRSSMPRMYPRTTWVYLQRRDVQAALLVGFWTIVGLIYVVSGTLIALMTGGETPGLGRIAWTLVGWYTWIPGTLAVLWMVRRFPVTRDTWARHLPLHVLAAPLISFAASALFTGLRALYSLAGDLQPENGWWNELIGVFARSVTLDSVIYLTLVVTVQAFVYHQMYRERELDATQLRSELAEAQLHALKMQLHPHFLFNTFHTIAMLVRERRDEEATDMIAGLSSLFRYVLDHAGKQEVSLEQELEFLDEYLAIEKVRFKEQLEVKLNVEPETLQAHVPTLLLQPLVENAIRHGIDPAESSGRVEVTARREGDRLRLRVRDNGSGLPAGWTIEDATGIGLANTRARLQRLYGDDQHFEVSNVSDRGGLMVTIVIPFRTQARYVDTEAPLPLAGA